MVRGTVAMVTAISGTYQCAEIARIAFGLVRRLAETPPRFGIGDCLPGRSWDCHDQRNSRHYNGHWGFLPCINDTGYFRCLSTYQNKTTKRALIYSISINLIRLIFRQLQPFDRVARVPCDIQTEFPVYQLCAKVRRLVDMADVLTKTDIVGQIGGCTGFRLHGKGGQHHDARRHLLPAQDTTSCSKSVWSVLRERGLQHVPILHQARRPLGVIHARGAMQALLSKSEEEDEFASRLHFRGRISVN